MFWIFGIGLLLAFPLCLILMTRARKVTVQEIDLSFETLPEAFDGYTILYLSDLHFNKREEKKTRLLASLASEPFDLCVVTGDMIEDDSAIHTCGQALNPLSAADGNFGVLGNHDYHNYSILDFLLNRHVTRRSNDTEGLVRVLHRTGFRVLRNESVEIRRDGASIWLAGADDAVTCRHDMEKSLTKVPQGAFTILLSHSPDVLKGLVLPGEHLTFAGHTHGGQVRLPVFGPIRNHSKLERGFISGQLRLERGTLVVSNGLGMNRFFPVRFRCRPEVHKVRLRRKAHDLPGPGKIPPFFPLKENGAA